MLRIKAASLLLASCVVAALPAHADDVSCGRLEQSFGPYDYRRIGEPSIKEALRLIEDAHFTPKVERLIAGQSGQTTIGADIDWTLHAFPNHHRALWSMARLTLREKRDLVRGAKWTIECYFERATRFQPDDPVPYSLFGLYLAKAGKRDAAATEFEKAAERAAGDANVHYNLGLGYLDLNHFDKAREHARLAYDAGFPLPGLRERLRAAGAWTD